MTKQISAANSRREFLTSLLGLTVALATPLCLGCASSKSVTKDSTAQDAFEDDDELDEKDVFSADRKNQQKLANFFANDSSKEKKSKVRPGDDFLLSSKAKEIYANTER